MQRTRAPSTKKLTEDDRLKLAMLFGEEKLFPQPLVDAKRAAERRVIDGMCFNDARVAPESILSRATEGKIGMIELFAYHGTALAPLAERYADEHRDEKVVHVGIEFTGGSHQMIYPFGEKPYQKNQYIINYDAHAFLRRCSTSSAKHVLIDVNDLGGMKIPLARESFRVLEEGGDLSMYVQRENRDEFERELFKIGYREVTYPNRTHDRYDFLTRRDHLSHDHLRVLAVK
jgi:hypothetical protein